jgi:hypothetical protein
MEGKRRREIQLFTPVKRLCPYVSPESLIPASLTPNTQRDYTRGLASVMVAAQQGSLPCVLFHIQSRGSQLTSNKYGPHSRSLLHLAAKADALDLVQYLRRAHRVDVFARDDMGMAPLDLAKAPAVRVFLEREVRWEQRKCLVFCFDHSISLLRRLPEGLFRAIFAEGFN